MQFGFIKTAAATPAIRVADCAYNARQIISCIHTAADQGAEIICLPELCITGYTCGDLFFQPALRESALQALMEIATATQKISSLIVVGLPFVYAGKLYNCAAVIQRGHILGIVPKTHLPNYNEFYEKRHFTSAPAENGFVVLQDTQVPFGVKLLFCCDTQAHLVLGIEICEDLWAPMPPSVSHAMAGATLIVNLSASDETVGKADYRRSLVTGQSARLVCGYVYCDAGDGESTTDMVFAGHNLIAENGALLSQSALFSNQIVYAEIDVDKLFDERLKNTTFPPADQSAYYCVSFSLMPTEQPLMRQISSAPFIPDNNALRAARCEAILAMQAHGLKTRLAHTQLKTAVVGISGGLDSSLALLVVARAFAQMEKPAQEIIAVTMPCIGTTARTRSNAEKLCAALGVTLRYVDITDTVNSNFKDIGQDPTVHDVTFENVQARVRTLVLMNIANKSGGLVVGTGDLSELALGWATYNGDHMSMYGVNASVPKTLMRHIVGYIADTTDNNALREVLQEILATPVSPELLPAENGEISQQTEEIVGPYELHDFFLYYAIRWGFSPAKIYFLAQNAFCEKYSDAVLYKWLHNFYRRFFAQQFKRNCLPDGPKVGSVTLSPRGDWRMPSDASAAVWMEEIENLNRRGS